MAVIININRESRSIMGNVKPHGSILKESQLLIKLVRALILDSQFTSIYLQSGNTILILTESEVDI